MAEAEAGFRAILGETLATESITDDDFASGSEVGWCRLTLSAIEFTM